MTEYDAKLAMQNMILRWFIVLLLLIGVFGIISGYIIEENRRSEDNRLRAMHWQKTEDGLDRIRSMIDKNYQMLRNNDEQLDKCASCHTHSGVHK